MQELVNGDKRTRQGLHRIESQICVPNTIEYCVYSWRKHDNKSDPPARVYFGYYLQLWPGGMQEGKMSKYAIDVDKCECFMSL